MVSEPICWALSSRGAGCLKGLGTYLPGTFCKGAGCLSGVGTYLVDTELQGCRLFKLCRNLLARHCVAGVQAV